MSTTAAVAGFKVSVDARDAASVEQGLAALGAARETIQRESTMLYVQCAGGECPEAIHALLAEWGYQAIARIPASSTLCFARAGAVAVGERASSSSPGVSVSVRENLQVLRARASSLLMQNRVYRGVHHVTQDFRGLRPSSLRARKLHKLLVDPERFLSDSSHPALSGPGLWAYRTIVPASESNSGRRELTVFDVPKRTLLICLGEVSPRMIAALSSCSQGLSLKTELVLILPSAQSAASSELLAAVRCPRFRLYIMGASEPEKLLRYGLARAYSTNVAILSDPTRCSAESIDQAFSLLTRENDHFFDRSQRLMGARREAWRDYLAGERHNAALEEGVGVVLATIAAASLDSKEPIPRTEEISDYSRYPGVDPSRPFAEQHGQPAQVTCFDRKVQWPRPSSPNWDKEEALITVIMTVYNAADTVAAAIDSVLAQTYTNLELIIVDDCSPDDSLRVLRERAAKDDRVRVLQTARNSGTYYAKNVGLRFARGAFVTFHDSDDVSSLNRLELQSQALSADPDAIGNYTRYQRLSEDGHEVWLNGRTNRPGYITLMFRRQAAMEAVGFFDSVRVSADAEFVERLQIATGRDVRLLPVVTYYALQAEGSLTTAGAAAFGVDAEGRSTMPPVREIYRDASRRWHGDIFDGLSSAVVPFPLQTRPFYAPPEIRPESPGRHERS